MRTIDELPGPPALPLLGNALSLTRASRIHLVAEKWARRYGPIIRIRIGPRLLVGIGDREAIGEILRDRPEGFRRWKDQKTVVGEVGGTGLFLSEGEDWKRQRRLVVTALNANRVQRYFDVLNTSTARLHRRLSEAAADGRSLAIGEELHCFTVDVTSALAFGEDLNTLERRDNELQDHIQLILTMTARRLRSPIAYWRFIRFPADRALDRSMEAITAAMTEFVEQAQQRMNARPELYEEPRNLLEGMLAAQRKDGTFSDEEVGANVLTVLFAGEDTTANTLAWVVWLLASRPEIQARLAEESLEVLGDELFPGDSETVERLSYTEAVLREAMRLKPVGPIMPVEPNQDVTICGTHIPAGTQILLLMRHATITPAGRGDDFYPERWIEEGEENAAPKSLSFGEGPRFCPGRNLAFIELKVVLAMIARNFEFELDPKAAPVEEEFAFAMGPRGLRVHMRERTSSKAGAVAGIPARR